MRHAPGGIRELAARFWSKVDQAAGPDGCWHWKGATNSWGYGYFRVGRHMLRAHRVAYTLTHGGITAGLYVLHSCDIRGCCNPAHLREGTQAENVKEEWDRYRKPARELTLLACTLALDSGHTTC